MGERLVVVGGDAAGMAAASVARRRRTDLEIVAIERSRWTSTSACGVAHLAAGDVGALDDLVARTPEQFRAMRIDVRTEHEVTGIDLGARQVTVHNAVHGRTFKLGFDLLHLATGAQPLRPDLPGLDADHVHGVQTLGDARRLLDDATTSRPERVAVLGSGYIGLGLAEAFTRRGASVTVVEQAHEVMPTLDPDMGALVGRAMRSHGIEVRLGETLQGADAGAVHTTGGTLPADLIVLGLGAGPDTTLAAAAGLELGVGGAVVVDRRQRASVDGVWAAGDCCQTMHLVSGRPVHQPLGTVANKQGLVAGINLGGGYATFPGVVGTAIARICDTEVARTGLDEAEATAAGFGVVTARVDTTVTAAYLPEAGQMTVKLVAEAGTGRLLGAQIVGSTGAAKRIDTVATALTARLDLTDLLMLDLAYAPSVSSVWDPLQVAARQALAVMS